MSAPPQWSLTAFDTALEAHIKTLTKHEKRLIEGSQPDFVTIRQNIEAMDHRHKRSHTRRFLSSIGTIYNHFDTFFDFLKDALSAAPFYVGLIFRSITYIMQVRTFPGQLPHILYFDPTVSRDVRSIFWPDFHKPGSDITGSSKLRNI